MAFILPDECSATFSIDGSALIFRVFWREPDPSVETALPLATLPPIAVSQGGWEQGYTDRSGAR
jgi:hypothetical protein